MKALFQTVFSVTCLAIVTWLAFRTHDIVTVNKEDIRNVCYHMEVTKL